MADPPASFSGGQIQPGRQGTGQQDQEQHATQRHGLRQDGQAMDDDREVAEDVDQQLHGSGACHGEGNIAAGDVPIDRQNLPAHYVCAGRDVQMATDDVGRSLGIDGNRGSGSGPAASGSDGNGPGRSGCCSETSGPADQRRRWCRPVGCCLPGSHAQRPNAAGASQSGRRTAGSSDDGAKRSLPRQAGRGRLTSDAGAVQ